MCEVGAVRANVLKNDIYLCFKIGTLSSNI